MSERANFGKNILEIGRKTVKPVEVRNFSKTGTVTMELGWKIYLTEKAVWSTQKVMSMKACGSKEKSQVTAYWLSEMGTISRVIGSRINERDKAVISSSRKIKCLLGNGSTICLKLECTVRWWVQSKKKKGRLILRMNTVYLRFPRLDWKIVLRCFRGLWRKLGGIVRIIGRSISLWMSCLIKMSWRSWFRSLGLMMKIL